ncbi:hypothetical protein [Paenibacillus macquariensis]|uniref:DUF2269 family protein n=1 Tax=Paenibacillus macquariensis TaxID=948756 RepID=A0ABY1JXP7_9BACL|nr:hypothetical protein [Paenibacillus macquariensis]MEC0089280.1 hypothetical protein [Paenibacillus macquariensis]OAB33312.1 hypothetical protein PMSM_14980 [Paenibacillus macquariensis subsp. macquariensis]SIQ94762.1 hypothetical protein SAMN05421578_105177 [Paenibacillus macquariensis]
MWNVMSFVHILGALSVGFYLLLPFIVSKMSTLSLPAQEGTAVAIRSFNIFAQVGLLIQFITGGYMMSQGDYSPAWMAVTCILIVALFAVSGMMSKPLKAAVVKIKEKRDISAEAGKLRVMSAILAVCLLVMVYFMVFNTVI